MVFGIPHFWLFAVTVLLINITPGATFLAVGSNAVTKGVKAGVFTAAGAGSALLLYALLCRAGLSAFIIHSPFWLNAIRYAGAAYLFYCAVKAFMQPPFDIDRVNKKGNAGHLKKRNIGKPAKTRLHLYYFLRLFRSFFRPLRKQHKYYFSGFGSFSLQQ